jgi:hypothetical protein
MSSFRYPCLVTTYALLPSLPWLHLRESSGIPGSPALTGGFRIHRKLLSKVSTPLGKRFSRTLAVSIVSTVSIISSSFFASFPNFFS